jgi:Thiamine pyrophosphate-requiring enzymes [acetolactate synthase, pyruvate dehydrogenase (cytochrome), glyoxylate carboligase, phosphonopyruvate decarboxylase]
MRSKPKLFIFDPSEINKNVPVDVPILSDAKLAKPKQEVVAFIGDGGFTKS